MGRRGRKRRLGVEDEYWRLTLSGVGTVEACRLLRIGRKTGYRWRAEHGGLPPLRVAEAVRGPRYLSRFERQRIASLREQGLGVRQIAGRLDRSASTISRELRRNVRPHDGDDYDGDLAHARACVRARRQASAGPAGRRRRAASGRAGEAPARVEPRADQRLAPVRLPRAPVLARVPRDDLPGPLQRFERRSEQDVDQAAPHRAADAEAATSSPRAPASLYRSRSADRPAPAGGRARLRLGDWEGDLIAGRNNHSAIGTLVERHSRFVVLVHLPAGRSADELRDALARLPRCALRSPTWDQGSEMARHDEIGRLFDDGVFFAYPGRPWERGSNENANGLLRQYFPMPTLITWKGVPRPAIRDGGERDSGTRVLGRA